uniref:Uncharacterized protein n=1 Tax=Timema genevievae TaxID=629358 RepID=A0A7R9JZP2_TIMGE|nr:unnamed protein product [Timema genevievae]
MRPLEQGQAVQRARLLDEAIESVVVLPSSSALDKQNDGRLVYVSGILQVGEPLTEMEYGIAMSAIKLKRRVQIEFPLMSTVYISEDASVGRFSLSHALKNKFNDFTLFTGDERPERRDIKLHSGLYYHCQDVWNPEVGDIRVQFSYAGKTGEMVSLLAQQTGSVLQPYLTPTGMSVAVVHQGTHTVQQMFQEEHTRNWLSGWPLRGAGWILIFIGGKCATTIINHFGKF